MSEGVSIESLKRVFQELDQVFQRQKDHLIALDSQIGDGDLGLTMVKGFSAANEASLAYQGDDFGAYFRGVGMSFVSKAPSTMGTLLGSGFIAAGRALKGWNVFAGNELSTFYTAFADGIAQRGKVKPGEKTAYDIFWAVSEHLKASTSTEVSLSQLLKDSQRVARQRGNDIRSLRAQHGKAAVFQEKTVGMADPGAEAAVLLVEQFARVLLGEIAKKQTTV